MSDTSRRGGGKKMATKGAAAKRGGGARRAATRVPSGAAAAAASPADESLAAEPFATAAAPVLAPRRSPTAIILVVTVLLAVALGAAYATTPLWSPRLAAYLPAAMRDPFQDPRLTGLDERLRTLEEQRRAGASANIAVRDLEAERARFTRELKVLIERVEGLEAAVLSVRKMVEATSAPGQAADAEESLRRLSERLASLEEIGAGDGIDRLAAKDKEITKAMADIAERVRSVERAGRTQPAAALAVRAVVVAVGQLREALHTSAPFARSLEALQAVAGGHADMVKAIAVLEPDAARGIPALARLRARFDSAAGRIVGAARELQDDGWVDRTFSRLLSLVTWRRTAGDAAGDSAEAVVARVEASLEVGDLMGAVEAVGSLDGPAAAAAAAWLVEARRRLAAERALASLHVLAVSLVAPGEE